MSIQADKRAAVIQCDGYGLSARPCPGSIEVGWVRGVPRSQAEAEKEARRTAKGKGWSTSEGEDRCPKLHADDKAKRR